MEWQVVHEERVASWSGETLAPCLFPTALPSMCVICAHRQKGRTQLMPLFSVLFVMFVMFVVLKNKLIGNKSAAARVRTRARSGLELQTTYITHTANKADGYWAAGVRGCRGTQRNYEHD